MRNKIYQLISVAILMQLICFNAQSQSANDSELFTNVFNFDWMPDGESICFAVIRGDKARKLPPTVGIFQYNLKTQQTKLLIKDAHSPMVSPDGNRLAFTKTLGGLQGNNDVYIYDFKTKTEKPIATDTLLRESSPSWSPDGQKLVYTAMNKLVKGARPKDLVIWVIRLSNGEKKQISPTNGFMNYNPVWAPRTNKIVYYLEKGDNRDQIYLTDDEGSFHTNLTSDTTTHNFYPSWYGNKIIYTQSPGNVVVMEQDGSNKSVIKGLNSFLSRYNAKSDAIAYLTPPSKESPPEFKIHNMKTNTDVLVISRDELNKLAF